MIITSSSISDLVSSSKITSGRVIECHIPDSFIQKCGPRRKLNANWTVEFSDTPAAGNYIIVSPDVEKELTRYLREEIDKEITKEILDNLKQHAKQKLEKATI